MIYVFNVYIQYGIDFYFVLKTIVKTMVLLKIHIILESETYIIIYIPLLKKTEVSRKQVLCKQFTSFFWNKLQSLTQN